MWSTTGNSLIIVLTDCSGSLNSHAKNGLAWYNRHARLIKGKSNPLITHTHTHKTMQLKFSSPSQAQESQNCLQPQKCEVDIHHISRLVQLWWKAGLIFIFRMVVPYFWGLQSTKIYTNHKDFRIFLENIFKPKKKPAAGDNLCCYCIHNFCSECKEKVI